MFKLLISRRALYVCLLILLSVTSGYSQNYRINERTRLYTEETAGDSLLLKADNFFTIPLSLKLVLNLTNLQGLNPLDQPVILKPAGKGQIVARLKKIDPTAEFSCIYQWRIILGDITKMPDANVLYRFPFENVNAYHVSQGPGGDFSHQNSFAYDFEMPVGSPVVAARDGVVAFVDTQSDVGGPQASLIDKANIISVLHSDGTIANYVHLNKDGSLVKEGDQVREGEIIGFSGNTGYSTGAHLHFEVVQPSFDSNTKKWVKFKWDHPVYTKLQPDLYGTAASGSGMK